MKVEASSRPGMEIYPVAYGHEHETSHLVQFGGQPLTETADLANYFSEYIPTSYPRAGSFLANGFRIYQGGERFVEVATPECATPKELIAYQRAGRELFGQLFENFLSFQSQQIPDEVFTARIHDRAVDSTGSRKASHLNLGLVAIETLPLRMDTILNYQATRSFVVGAGFVKHNGYRFSQKVGGLLKTNGYGYFGSMYRTSEYEGTFRFEDRCGDVNLSDWSAWQRAGGMALAIAVSRTPLAKELPDINPNGIPEHELAKQLNVFSIQNGGRVKAQERDFTAVDFQQKLAELALDKLIFYSDDLPSELFEVARDLYTYSEGFRALLKGDAEIYEFDAQADCIKKLQYVLRDIEKDESFGIRRKLWDMESRAKDLRYDVRQYKARAGEVTKTGDGIADKLHRKGVLKPLTTPQAVARALVHAPSSTRASLREYLIRNFTVNNMDWHHATITDGNHSHELSMLAVTQTKFDGESLEKISEVRPISTDKFVEISS